MNAVMSLLDPIQKRGRADRSWKDIKVMMGPVDKFLETLVSFDKTNISSVMLSNLQPFLEDQNFNGEYISKKSVAAAGICEWVKNVVLYYKVFCVRSVFLQ
jgi:dynein heavy chain